MRKYISAFALVPFILSGCATSDTDKAFVERQWADSISGLGAGVQPIYPPTEDVQFGDVYAIESAVSPEGEVPRTMKLGYISEINELARRQYANRLMLPPSQFVANTTTIDRSKDQGYPNKSVFSGRFTTTLPIAAFPEYSLAHGVLIDFAASLPGKIFGFLFGLSFAESTDLRVSVSDNNTFGIPAYDAQALLARFCGRIDNPCDQGRMQQAFRDTYGRAPMSQLSVRLISRVYVTRTINYTYVFRSAAAVRAVQARLDSMKVFAEKASSLVTPPAVTADNPATATDESVTSARDVLLKQMMDSLRDDLVALSGNANGSAFTLSGASYAGNSIALSQSFVRPLTFAYGGVWWSGAILRPAPQARVGSPAPHVAKPAPSPAAPTVVVPMAPVPTVVAPVTPSLPVAPRQGTVSPQFVLPPAM